MRSKASLRLVAGLDTIGDFEYIVEFKSGKCRVSVKGSRRVRKMLREVVKTLKAEGLTLVPPPLGSRTWFYVTPDDYLEPSASKRTSTEDIIKLGYDVLGRSFGLSLDEVFRHIGIFGSTGSGKTTTAAVLARQAAQAGLSVVILDWHGEYKRLLFSLGISARYMGLNSLPTVSLIPEELPVDIAVDILSVALDLTEHQAGALQTVLTILREGSWKESVGGNRPANASESPSPRRRDSTLGDNALQTLLTVIKYAWERLDEVYGASIHYGSRSEREIWSSLYRRLYSIAISEYSRLFRLTGFSILRSLPNSSITILDLSGIKSPRVKKLYSLLLLKSFVDEAMASKRFVNVVVVVEEAHNVLGVEACKYAASSLGAMVAESRKYGIGFVIVTQSPSTLPQQILSNLNTVIVHRLPSPKDVKLILQDYIGRGRYLPYVVRCLQPGEAVVCSQGRPHCTLIKVRAGVESTVATERSGVVGGKK